MRDFEGKISVIIPAYNEKSHIYYSIKETSKFFESLRCQYEIIVIDDGSKDQTYDVAVETGKYFDNVQVFRYGANRGKGGALKYGFRFAKGDLIVFLDADLDIHPEQIETLFEYMKLYQADVVIGSKRHPHSELDYPWHRKMMSTVYYGLVKILFGLPVKDTQTGIKIFKSEVLQKVFPKILVRQFAFDLELLVNSHRAGYRIVEAPVRLDFKRKFGRIKSRDIINTFGDTLAIFYRLYFLKYYDRTEGHELPASVHSNSREIP